MPAASATSCRGHLDAGVGVDPVSFRPGDRLGSVEAVSAGVAQQVAQSAARLADRLIERDDAFLGGHQARPGREHLGDRGDTEAEVLVTSRGDRPVGANDGRGDVVDRPAVDEPERLHRRSGETGGAQDLGHVERQIEALASVEPWIAHRLVAIVELAVEDLVGAAHALGDVVAGELDVDASRPRALGVVGANEAVDLGDRCDRSRGSCGPLTEVKVLACIGSQAHTTG